MGGTRASNTKKGGEGKKARVLGGKKGALKKKKTLAKKKKVEKYSKTDFREQRRRSNPKETERGRSVRALY